MTDRSANSQRKSNMRLSGLVITLPLLVSVSLLVGHPASANAATLDPAKATQMLARANAADSKCNILDATQHQELKDYVARAEISLAEKQSVKAARSAIAGGKAAGQAMACDATAEQFVNSVLGAARGAVDALAKLKQPAAETVPPQVSGVATPIEPSPIVTTEPQTEAANIVVPAKPKLPKPAKQAAVAPTPKQPITATKQKGLDSYAAVAKKYYVELRCRSMSAQQINRLYANVLSSHRKALASNNPQAIKAMLVNVESSARRTSCG